MPAFHDVRFSTDISYGSVGGPGFNTNIVEMDSGVDERIQRWSAPRHKYDVSKGIQTLEALYEVKKFYIARGGPAVGFRYKDWQDFTSNNDNGAEAQGTRDQLIGTGNGSTTVFQLIKAYTSGLTTYNRTIEKPVTGTVQIWVNSVLQTETTHYNINYDTGAVTFVSAVTNTHPVHASFEYDVPVAFSKAMDDILPTSIDFFDSGSIGSITLEEVVQPDPPYTSEFPYGGSATKVITASTSLQVSDGRFCRIHASNPSLNVSLPNPASIPTGGAHFYIVNDDSGNTFTLKDHLGTTLLTLAVSKGAVVLLTVDSGGTSVWYAVG